MEVSLIICTYNRSESLRRTLDSIARLTIPDGLKWEVIIVDNNSKDNTREVVEKYRTSCGFCTRYVREDQQGLSYARNRGIKESRGRVIIFTDDDVIVDREWLRNIVTAFENHEVACVGGKILPVWEMPKPAWLSEGLYGYLALLDYGDTQYYVDQPALWGANFAVRTSAFRTHGLFNTNMGRVAGKLYAGEETSFLTRLLESNEKILYLPNAVVYHCIPKERMRKMYFRKWVFDQGELEGTLLGRYPHRNILGIPYYIVRRLITGVFLWLFGFVIKRQERFLHQLLTIRMSGFLIGRLRYGLTRNVSGGPL